MRRLKSMANQHNKLTKSDINKVYVRNLFGLQLGWNYGKMQGLGYAYVIMPALKRLYGDDPEAMKKALDMHLAYFNTTPAMSHLIIGADMAIEEEMGMESEEVVRGLKAGLMGPFAGVGDTLFIAIYRAIIFSIASYMALDGNAFGLVIPLIGVIAVMFVRYRFTYLGYEQGRKIATEFGNKLRSLTEGASILGLTVVGGLVASVITYKIDLTFNVGEVSMVVSEMLDKIMPGLIPVLIVFMSYKLLDKEKMTSTKLIFVLIGLGMVLGNLQNILNIIVGIFS
ncbi:PTS mannose transporter subunit IID [Erysipelothrix larvae]|uniref:PTS mannose transporter subunit IID n=2 Tax=Erysipelothrix larvae TaxID=1514105 RepID=A0A120JTZ5_9FIRM|nr:PTS mannose transporter subunit IID [Erysipelothrix larvae]